MAFKKVEGTDGNTVVPDLAEAIPTPQRRRQDLHLQAAQGIKFSTGKDVTAKDVVASFERIFKVSNPTAGTWSTTASSAPTPA